MSLKGLGVQVKPLQKFGTGKQCVKHAEIRAFFDPYFSVYEQNHIRIFPYLDRIGESVQIRKNADTILSIYRKIRIRESLYFGIFYTMESSWSSFDIY